MNLILKKKHVLKAKCFIQLNKIDEAIIFLDKAIEVNNISVLNLKGNEIVAQNESESKKLFERALDLNKNPNDAECCFNQGVSLSNLDCVI